jgi:hypothetical protein
MPVPTLYSAAQYDGSHGASSTFNHGDAQRTLLTPEERDQFPDLFRLLKKLYVGGDALGMALAAMESAYAYTMLRDRVHFLKKRAFLQGVLIIAGIAVGDGLLKKLLGPIVATQVTGGRENIAPGDAAQALLDLDTKDNREAIGDKALYDGIFIYWLESLPSV